MAPIDPKLKSETAGEKPFEHSVKVPLTDQEMLIYTDELTALDTKEQALTSTFESQKAAYKNDQAAIDKDKSRLMALLKAKEEWRDVECYNDFDFEKGICTIRRKSDESTVTTRKMNADEFRRALPFKQTGTESKA